MGGGSATGAALFRLPALPDPRMARTEFHAPRLCVGEKLAAGLAIPLSPEQANSLVNVLRLSEGARVLVFNGRDGEFSASLAKIGRKGATLTVAAQTRKPEAPPDVDFLFAPLKHARLDYMAQKAVEMGARRLRPVITRRTQVARLNVERLEANAIEACEQCGAVWTPEVLPPEPLEKALSRWPAERLLVFCDEGAAQADPLAALASANAQSGVGLLIGPEGGFAEDERTAILAAPKVVRLSLGPRVLRADTAAVAALALVQASLGDWRSRAQKEG